MEEKIINKIKAVKHESLLEAQLPGTECHGIKPYKNNLEIQEYKSDVNLVNKTETKKNFTNNTKVLKRKVTEDGILIERVLSEGEASSGFETVSSFDSKADFDDLDFSSSFDGDDFNVIVEIENELAFQNPQESFGRVGYRKGKSNSPVRYSNKTDRFLHEFNNRHSDIYGSFKDQKYSDNNSEKYYKFDRREKKSNEREEFILSRHGDHIRRSSRSKRSNRDSRSRRSRSSERINRSRDSRSSERNIRPKSPSYKDRKTEARRSGSFDKNSAKSYTRRNSPSRKRKYSRLSKSPSSSVWKRLDNRLSPSKKKKIKTTNDDRQIRNSYNSSYRKKERTPFLVELERKLKEVERLKNFKKDSTDCFLDQASGNINVTVPMLEAPPAINQNSNPLHPTTFIPSTPKVQGVIYPMQYLPMPTLSMDNLPLVPGPTGLPVHITMSGEQIPYDMDGRCIPIGPNGYYLPVDPTGRLFPHIVSPGNQAVPIHMTEDGVLRLPNSEPVPFGPGHQLPVNIDGSVILIGPDSKPLYPCPNLPKEPPLNLLQMMDSFSVGYVIPQQTVPVIPQPPQTDFQQNLIIAAQQTPSTNQINLQPPIKDSLLDFIQNPTEKINKAELLKKYKEKARERNDDVLKCVQIKKNLEVNSSRALKKSIPVKMLQRMTFKDDNCSSGSDMVLDSGDSDSASCLKFVLEPTKGLTEEVILSSDDEQNILKKVNESKTHKTQNTEASQEDPIVKKIQQVIKSLSEKNYKPPAFGRFIITNLTADSVKKEPPNESPLLRNRIKLPFLTPNIKDIHLKKNSANEEKAAVTFKFFPQKKTEKGERLLDFKYNKINNRNYGYTKFPVFTIDFSVQCDFTSIIIKNLTSKVSELEMELVRLRNVNANLVDGYRNVQALNEKKSDELVKATQEIQELSSKIQSLKHTIEKRQ